MTDTQAHPLVTFVCTGNICRSPMAERLLQQSLAQEEEPFNQVKVISAGTAAYDGGPASTNSILALKEVGLELSDFKSQALTRDIVDNSWIIFGLTEGHLIDVRSRFHLHGQKLLLMRELIQPPVDDLNISDPIGMGLSAYQECRDSMQEAIPSIVQFIKKELQKH